MITTLHYKPMSTACLHTFPGSHAQAHSAVSWHCEMVEGVMQVRGARGTHTLLFRHQGGKIRDPCPPSSRGSTAGSTRGVP